MKVLILSGVISAVCAGTAVATPSTGACQLDESRREAQERRIEAPASQAVRTTGGAPRAEEQARAEPPRRRYGKPIPDAELIGPRAVL
jgi:hypothetical protein